MTNDEQNIIAHITNIAQNIIPHKIDMLWYKCFYVNDVEHGYEEIYDKEGKLRLKLYHAR